MVDGRQKGHVFDFRFHHCGAVDVDIRRTVVFPVDFYSFSALLKNRRESWKDAADVHCCERHNILLTFLTLPVHMRPAAAHHAHDPPAKGSRRRREGDDDDRTCICRTRQHHGRCSATKFAYSRYIYIFKKISCVIGTRFTVNCTACGVRSDKLLRIPFESSYLPFEIFPVFFSIYFVLHNPYYDTLINIRTYNLK